MWPTPLITAYPRPVALFALGPVRQNEILGEILGRLNPQSVIHRLSQSLLAPQVFFCRLYGYMAEQELDLLQFATRLMTEPGTRSSEVVWREFRYSQSFRVFLLE